MKPFGKANCSCMLSYFLTLAKEGCNLSVPCPTASPMVATGEGIIKKKDIERTVLHNVVSHFQISNGIHYVY